MCGGGGGSSVVPQLGEGSRDSWVPSPPQKERMGSDGFRADPWFSYLGIRTLNSLQRDPRCTVHHVQGRNLLEKCPREALGFRDAVLRTDSRTMTSALSFPALIGAYVSDRTGKWPREATDLK